MTSRAIPHRTFTVKLSTASILSAAGIVLSYLNPFGYVLIFGAKIDPFAHFINAIAGVLLGPWFALLTAFIIATVRVSLGMGTILAFPGGLSGALVVGLFQQLLLRRGSPHINFAAFTEPLGTVFLGGTIAGLIIPTPFLTFWWLFALASIPGCVLGWVLLKALDRAGISATYFPQLSNDITEEQDYYETPIQPDRTAS